MGAPGGTDYTRVGVEQMRTNTFPRMQSRQYLFRLDAAGALDPATIQISEKFEVRSIRIDNMTGGWLRLLPNFDFVRFYTLRAVWNVRGLGTVVVQQQTPSPAGAGMPLPNELIVVTLYDKPQAENHAGETYIP